MSDVDIQIQGVEKLLSKLNNVTRRTYLKAAMQAAVEHLASKLKTYPPETAANVPSGTPGARWYKRGTGGFYNRKRDGGTSIYKTSKNLQSKWTTQVDADGMRAQVGNNVSYAPYVQDEREQMPWHKAHGWGTVQDVAKSEKDKIVKLFQDRIRDTVQK